MRRKRRRHRTEDSLIRYAAEGMRRRRLFGGRKTDHEGHLLLSAPSPMLGRSRRPASDCCRPPCVFWPSASRKEVIQPQVPLRLPCYDFTPVADLTVVGYLP